MMRHTCFRWTFQTAAACLLCCTALPVASAGPPRYKAKFITPGIDAFNATAMNENGDVVGTITTGPGTGAWVSRAGAPAVFLPLPPGVEFGFANDINDAGVIVGSVGYSYPGYAKAAAWIPDGAGGYTIQQFGTLPGDIYSDALAINNVGDIVGYSRDGMFHHPVLFTGSGGIQDLRSTGLFDPCSINDQRVLVDQSYPTKRMDLDTMVVENLPAPGTGYSTSWGKVINESGQVGGRVTNTTCGEHFPQNAARYTDGVGWEVLSDCGRTISVSDMNDLGDVIIASSVRFEGLGVFYIYDLIDADVGQWTTWGGYQLTINNARQMAVPATNSFTGENGIILLTPVGGGIDCNAIAKFSAKCTNGKLVAKVKSTLPVGTQLTIDNGGDVQTMTINDRGVGKVKYKGQSGPHTATLVECPTFSAFADCG